MSAYSKINRNPPRKELVKLAFVFLIFLGAMGAYQSFVKHQESTAHTLWAAAGVLFVLSLLPKIGRVVYIGWMGLGVTMGMFTQPIFLFVTYVLFFIPIGLVFRLIARDTMKRKLTRDKSYWEEYKESTEKSSYFKQY